MKTFKIVACLVMVVAALAYAGLPPISVGGLVFKGVKAAGTMVETNGWIVVSGYDLKTTFQLDKTSPAPTGQKIVIAQGKALKASLKTPGNFDTIIYGQFVSGAEGDLSQLTLNDPLTQGGKSFGVSLKGVTVGTVIAKRTAPKADNIKNALLTEIKDGKGVAVTAGGKTPLGVLGGTSLLDLGWLGVSPSMLPLKPQVTDVNTRIGKATGKGAISDLQIYAESLPEKAPGKPAAQLSAKVMARVFALEPGVGTNSAYKSKVAGEPTYNLVKP